MRVGRDSGIAVLAAVVLGVPAMRPPARIQATPARVGVWYRGTPAGVPVQDELALIRAVGFSAVVWPFEDQERAHELERIADVVGLVVMRPAEIGREPARWHDESPAGASPALMPARVWLAVAEGAHVVTFDGRAPTGAGITQPTGAPAPWVAPAVAFARQVTANAELFGLLTPAVGIDVDVEASAGSPARVMLLDGGPAWVLVLANPSPAKTAVVARFPKTVPYGPWVSLIDGSELVMRDMPGHREYQATLAAGAALVYVVDKVQK
jgi:hypothetical protein